MFFKQKGITKAVFDAYAVVTAICAVGIVVSEAFNTNDDTISGNIFKYFMDSNEPEGMFNTPFTTNESLHHPNAS